MRDYKFRKIKEDGVNRDIRRSINHWEVKWIDLANFMGISSQRLWQIVNNKNITPDRKMEIKQNIVKCHLNTEYS